ncbi:MAG: SDR family NAD(P)-dependent oxidoreductase [Mycobacterium leprae]
MVTGANNGIGYYITERLLAKGYRVAGLDLDGGNLATLGERYADRLGYWCCDVSSDSAVEMAVGGVVGRWGRIDIVVNSACLALFQPFAERSLETIRREFEVNYYGYLRLIRAVLPVMRQQGGGVIHNVSSGVGLTGFPGLVGYTSTKGAIEALTRTLALELAADGITVNLFHPPLTKTKSAAPLGIPDEAMADPVKVGHGFAERIESHKPVVTPDFSTAVAVYLFRRYPEGLGRLLAKLTARARGEARAAMKD